MGEEAPAGDVLGGAGLIQVWEELSGGDAVEEGGYLRLDLLETAERLGAELMPGSADGLSAWVHPVSATAPTSAAVAMRQAEALTGGRG